MKRPGFAPAFFLSRGPFTSARLLREPGNRNGGTSRFLLK